MPGSVDVSIVVIAFNEQATIEACVGALLAQRTTRSLEVVVVDDGSSDRTAVLVQELTRLDPRVRTLVHERNQGRGAARRTGQDASNAPLIGYVDADVIVSADWLERCAAALGTHGAVSGIAVPDGDCVVLVRLLHPSIRVRPHTMPISGGNVLFDAPALRAVGFDERARLGEDFRLARRMIEHGYRIATVPGLDAAEHREQKTYRSTMRWMWQNGRDAARLPFEFRIVRTPDVTWLGWVVVVVAFVGLMGARVVPWGPGVVAIAACTGAIAIGHTASRFRLVRPLRWLAAAVLDVPLVTSYLVGRTVGFPAALHSARPGASRPVGQRT